MKKNVLRAFPEDALPDQGPVQRSAWPLYVLLALLVLAVLLLAVQRRSAEYQRGRFDMGAVILLLLLSTLILRTVAKLFKHHRAARPEAQFMDVLRAILQFEIPRNVLDVAIAAFCRPDTARPNDALAVLVFVQNHASRHRIVNLQLGRSRAIGLGAKCIKLYVGPGQCAVYRTVAKVSPTKKRTNLIVRGKATVYFPAGRGVLLDNRSRGVPFTEITRRRHLMLPLQIQPYSEAPAVTDEINALEPPPDTYTSIYSSALNTVPRFAVLHQLATDAADELTWLEDVADEAKVAAAEAPEYSIRPTHSRFTARQQAIAVAMAVVTCLGVLLLIAVPAFLREAWNRGRPHSKRFAIEAFHEPTRAMPADWLHAEPWPADLLRNVHDVQLGWRDVESSASADLASRKELRALLQTSQTLVGDLRTTAIQIVAQYGAFADAYAKLADHPNYETDLLTPPAPMQFAGALKGLQLTCDVLSLRAQLAAQNGNYESAFENVGRIAALARSHPSSAALPLLLAYVCTSSAARTLYRVGMQCNDVTALERGIALCPHPMAALPLRHHPNEHMMDMIGALRTFQRHGYEVDLPTSPTGVQVALTFTRAISMFPYWARAHVGPDDTRRALMSGWEGLGQQVDLMKWLPVTGPFWRDAILDMMISLGLPDYAEMENREKHACTLYDLAVLELYERVCELRGQPRDIECPDWIIDRYDSDEEELTYNYSADRQCFYSIGADYEDQNAELLYDPTNGSDSKGDVFLVRPVGD